eukprot:gnl/TRDRNA2_/TRDRNA2_166478_c2_seq3.p1 gnl/TRDRNA2_/TRDRNA2_166478_c2~~gnl/TRDRNA2_/TRDRNA2_166478_c2_seq3.p1  ORF type:complete len:445 (-),score=59.94 gnl/TRDRNA2_/TRDRNA2_166478_c2_seq3:34-1368(-)
MAGSPDDRLLANLAATAMRREGDLTMKQLGMMLLALCRCEDLSDAWSLFDHAKAVSGISFAPFCFEALLMECEQRGLLEHEVAVLQALERAARAEEEFAFAESTRRVAAMRLSKMSDKRLPLIRHEPGDAHLPDEQVMAPRLDAWRRQSEFSAHAPYAKELNLLQHVLSVAKPGDPASVCKAIEDFGEEVVCKSGLWLKVAGGSKAEVLKAAARRAPSHGSILEIGTYCGYSAIRLATACPGTSVVTLEADPAHVIIARNILAFAGLTDVVDVWTGHSKEILSRLRSCHKGRGHLPFRAVFMDQKGSRYVEDLEMLENESLMLSDAVVVADNVLRPGAPLFLWRIMMSGQYKTQVIRLKEFAMEAEDWMSVSVRKSHPENARSSREVVPDPPWELVQLELEADQMRAKATTGHGVTYGEWPAFAKVMEARLNEFGIVPTNSLHD